jgi:hypothetical protein
VPNEISQSNISPEDAVQYWKQYMTPLGEKGYKLGMAAPTNAPSGLEWVNLESFRIDVVPVQGLEVVVAFGAQFHEFLQGSMAAPTNAPSGLEWVKVCQILDASAESLK